MKNKPIERRNPSLKINMNGVVATTIVIIIIIGVILIIFVTLATWNILSEKSSEALQSNKLWSVLSTIIAGLALIGIYLTYRQSRFEVWIKAQDIFMDKEFTAARSRLFSSLDKKKKRICCRSDAYIVCRKLDELAHLEEYFPIFASSIILKEWGNQTALAWSMLQDFVNTERELPSGFKSKWQAFEDLGVRAGKKYPDKKESPVKIVSDWLIDFF